MLLFKFLQLIIATGISAQIFVVGSVSAWCE
jgi:hypothetical protein